MNVLQIKRGNFADLPTGADRLKPGEMYFAEDINTFLVGKNDQSTAQFIGDGVKVYKAILTQSGLNAPGETILVNSTDELSLWGRLDVGVYFMQGISVPVDKTFITISNTHNSSDEITLVEAYVVNDTKVRIKTRDIDGVLADSITTEIYIEILIFP